MAELSLGLSENIYNILIRDLTEEYIAGLDVDNPPTPSEFEADLLANFKTAILMRNTGADKRDTWAVVRELPAAVIARALAWRYHFVRIDFSDGEERETTAFPLHWYDEDEGIYVECEQDNLGKLVRQFRFTADGRVVSEVMAILREDAPVVCRTRDMDLVAVHNGIVRRSTRELLPFSPDYIFTCKTAVDWPDVPPQNVTLLDDGIPWNLEDAFVEFGGDDAEIGELLWQVVAMPLRPNVRWDKSIWFYSKSGNNGKGTICQLIRNIVGPGNHTSIPFADFNNSHFMLGALPRVQAVICDENQVGKYADDNAEFKAAVTNDIFRIDRKHKPPITARFHGTVIQCVNEIPRIRDRSDSFWRRVCVIAFDQCFTGHERPIIKHDYIARKEVLEYAQYRALTMDFDELQIPDKCKLTLEEFKQESNPVLQFAYDVLPRAQWDVLPWQFLWDLYKAWYEGAYNKSNSGFGRNKFFDELASAVDTHPDLGFVHDRGVGNAQGRKWSSAKYMDGPEALISEYGLNNPRSAWANLTYVGTGDKANCPSNLSKTYRGLVRASVWNAALPPADDEDEDKDD